MITTENWRRRSLWIVAGLAVLLAGLWAGNRHWPDPQPHMSGHKSDGPYPELADFEDGTLGIWRQAVDGEPVMQVVETPVRAGKHAAMFGLGIGKSGRGELARGPDAQFSEQWFGLSIYIPADFPIDHYVDLVSQWHEVPDRELGEPSRVPPLSLGLQCGEWYVDTRWHTLPVTTLEFSLNPVPPDGGFTRYVLGPPRREGWTDWVFHIRWTYHDDGAGLVEVWKDGVLVVRHLGRNTYNDQSGTFYKFGLYHPFWKNGHRPPDAVATWRHVFIDEVRVASGPDGYAKVAPTGGSATVNMDAPVQAPPVSPICNNPSISAG